MGVYTASETVWLGMECLATNDGRMKLVDTARPQGTSANEPSNKQPTRDVIRARAGTPAVSAHHAAAERDRPAVTRERAHAEGAGPTSLPLTSLSTLDSAFYQYVFSR